MNNTMQMVYVHSLRPLTILYMDVDLFSAKMKCNCFSRGFNKRGWFKWTTYWWSPVISILDYVVASQECLKPQHCWRKTVQQFLTFHNAKWNGLQCRCLQPVSCAPKGNVTLRPHAVPSVKTWRDASHPSLSEALWTQWLVQTFAITWPNLSVHDKTKEELLFTWNVCYQLNVYNVFC